MVFQPNNNENEWTLLNINTQHTDVDDDVNDDDLSKCLYYWRTAVKTIIFIIIDTISINLTDRKTLIFINFGWNLLRSFDMLIFFYWNDDDFHASCCFAVLNAINSCSFSNFKHHSISSTSTLAHHSVCVSRSTLCYYCRTLNDFLLHHKT